MSAYSKMLALHFAAFALFVAVTAVAATFSKYYIFLGLPALWGLNELALSIKCPRCGTPISRRGSLRLVHRSLGLRSRCRNCGFDLTTNRPVETP